MTAFWVCVGLVLAGSLTLPRAWLHGIGIVGCGLLLWHAVELGDPAFVIVQIACIVFHAAGLMLWTLGRKLAKLPPLENDRLLVIGEPARLHDEQHECWRNN